MKTSNEMFDFASIIAPRELLLRGDISSIILLHEKVYTWEILFNAEDKIEVKKCTGRFLKDEFQFNRHNIFFIISYKQKEIFS